MSSSSEGTTKLLDSFRFVEYSCLYLLVNSNISSKGTGKCNVALAGCTTFSTAISAAVQKWETWKNKE
jgi:hypothetical protein